MVILLVYSSNYTVLFPVMQNELLSVFETLSSGVWDEEGSAPRTKSSDIALPVMDQRRLIELLQICTFIAQGQQHSLHVSPAS